MKTKAALLITSAQNDLLSPKGKAWALVQETVTKNQVPQKLNRLITTARASGMPVIHSPVSFDFEALKSHQPLSAIQSVIFDNHLLAVNTEGVQYIPEAMPQEGDIVLPPRQGFSSFWAQSIQSHLNDLGISTVFIAGMLAEGCVESHSRDAVENGYRPIVISDAIGSTSSELLEASLKTLALHSSQLKTTDEVIDCWGK